MLTPAVLGALFLQCAPDISPVTLNALVGVESAGKPYVVANVTDNTSHYFDSKEKATLFLNEMSSKSKRYSAGLMQIYSGNFSAYGLTNETVFDHCTNIKAGAEILKKCYNTASKETNDPQIALRKAMSCYYSGNFTRGFKQEADGKSYVQRIELKVNKDFAVPEMKTVSNQNTEQNKSSPDKTVVYSSQEITKNSWDVFGDY